MWLLVGNNKIKIDIFNLISWSIFFVLKNLLSTFIGIFRFVRISPTLSTFLQLHVYFRLMVFI